MKLLFLCPHSAAKSVLATVAAKQIIEQEGLSIEVDFAGTEPDAQIMPSVADRLHLDGIDTSGLQPRIVTAEALSSADRIISLGCTMADLDKVLTGVSSRVEFWNDVPMVSQNLPVAYAVIQQQVQSLLENVSVA